MKKKTFKKLKPGKKYVVMVRARRLVDGKWYNSKWSKARTIRAR